MSGGWRTLSLREANVHLIDCDHRTPPPAEVGYPYVAIPQLRNGRIDLSSVRRITREHFVEWTKKGKPTANDVVLSRRCNPGETAFVPPDLELALGQNLVLLRADGTRVYPPFLRWLVRGPAWWEQVGKFLNVGAVFDSLKCGDVPNFRLHIPPLNEQRAIAHILATLDDKIEVNRRMSATLEAMARALFKSWFVDFEPVRAKSQGRDPGLPPHIAALFPARLIETEQGEIPEGWRISSIGDEVRVVGGSTPSTTSTEFWDGKINWATPKDLAGLNSPVLLETSRKIKAAGLAKISSGLLPAGTVLLSSRAPIGYLAIAEVPVAINQGFIAMVCERQLSKAFVWLWTLANMEAILANANGSTFQEVSKSNFRPLAVVMPPRQVTQAFDGMADALYARIAGCERQSRTLAALRDTLLPKLISGELRVKDAERALARASV